MSLYQRRLREDFSAAAPRYDQHAHLQRQVTRELAEWARPLFHHDARWLDAGCGTGAFGHWVRQSLPPMLRLWQADCAEGMCLMARRHGHPTLCADLQQLPLPSGSVDGVFTSLALQWATPLTDALAELRRVTRPGGTMALSTLVPGTLSELETAFLRLREPARLHPFRDMLEWQDALERSGWQIQEERHRRIVLSFASPREVLEHLRGLGATQKGEAQPPLTRHRLDQLLTAYPKADDGSAPATFEVWMALASAAA